MRVRGAALAGLTTRAQAQLADPVLRNGYALVANTVVTALLGLAYWILAARLFSPDDIGRGAAAVTAMTLLSSIAGMNLSGVLSFLLPQAGRSARSFILKAYGASTAIAVVLVLPLIVFAALDQPVPGLSALSRTDVSLLAGGTLIWVLFTLQDGVLTGLRRSVWVLVENSAFSVVKLVLLPVLALLGLSGGVYLSWLLPTVVAVVVVNVLLALRLLPALADVPDTLSMRPRELRRFVGVNYVGAVLYQGYFNLMPVLVLVENGSRANGLFFVAWTLASSLDLLSHSMGSALTVEGAGRPELMAGLINQVLRRVALLVLPVVVVTLVAAPLVLLTYGRVYADASSGVLRLLVLGAVPRAVVIIAQAAARASGNAGVQLRTEALTCLLVLGPAAVLLPSVGPLAVGIAWLLGNTLVLLTVLQPLRRALRQP